MTGRWDTNYLVNKTDFSTFAFGAVQLDQLCSEVFQGVTIKSTTDVDSVRALRVKDFDLRGRIDLSGAEPTAAVPARKILMRGDIITPFIGETIRQHKTAIFEGEDGRYTIDGNVGVFRPRNNLIVPRFLYALICSSLVTRQIEQLIGGGGVPFLGSGNAKQLMGTLPPLDVQHRLVAELDAARDERDRSMAESERLLSTFEPWAIKEMGLSAPKEDVRKVYAIKRNAAGTRIDPFYHSPEFVEIERTILAVPHARLGSLVQFSGDTWDAKAHPEPAFRYIEISGVDRRRGQASASDISVADAPSRARMVVQPDDIIVSLTRPHHGSIALLNDAHEGCIASTGFAVIRSVDESRISRTFLWAVLRLSLSLKQMLRRASGGNYPAITQDELSNVLVPLPDKFTQEKIVDEVVRRNKQADQLEAHAETVWREARARFEQQLLQGGAP